MGPLTLLLRGRQAHVVLATEIRKALAGQASCIRGHIQRREMVAMRPEHRDARQRRPKRLTDPELSVFAVGDVAGRWLLAS